MIEELQDALCLAVSLVTGPMIRETCRWRPRSSAAARTFRSSWAAGTPRFFPTRHSPRSAADLTSAAFNRPTPWTDDRQHSIAPDAAALEQGIADLIEHYPTDGVILESPDKLRRIASRTGAPRCNAPWVSAVPESNGDVRPCFFHSPIGSTASGTLREILNVAENETRRRCSLYLSEAASANPEALGPVAAGGYGLQA